MCPNTGLDLDDWLGNDSMKAGKPTPSFAGGEFKAPLVPITDRVALFAEFETQALILEPEEGFRWDEVAARSLMTALLVVSPHILQAERREVGGLLHPRRGERLQVVLYDNVHGGAGLMKGLVEALSRDDGLLEGAFDLLSRCEVRAS